jgi:hypothetical protein
VFFGITLPWFVGLCLRRPDFLRYGLVEESFHRFTTAKTFHRHEPFYFFLLVIAGTFFPWSLLLPEAGLAAWRERWLRRHRADRLCLIWSLVVVVFFSISQSKLPGYILSVTVATGILLARLFDAALANSAGRAARLVCRATSVFAIACLLLAVAGMAGMSQSHLLARPLHLPVADAEQLGRVMMPLGITFAACGAFALVACWWRSVLLCFLALALVIPLGGNTGMGVIDVIFGAKSGRPIARQLATLSPETELASLECFPNGVPFYLHRTVTLISDAGGELTSNYITYCLNKEAPWPEQVVPLADFETWLASRKTPIYLVVREGNRERLEALAASRGATVQPLAAGYFGARLPAPGGT